MTVFHKLRIYFSMTGIETRKSCLPEDVKTSLSKDANV